MRPVPPRGAPTFRARLALNLTLFSLGVLAVASAAIYVGVRRTLWANLDTALITVARTEIASAIDEPGGPVHVHDVVPAPLALTGEDFEKVAWIKDGEGKIYARTVNLAAGPALTSDPTRERKALEGVTSFGFVWRGEERFRALYQPLQDSDGKPLVSLVAISTRPLRQALWHLIDTLGVAFATAGLLAVWGARRLAGRLTKPLDDIAASAAAIGEQTLGVRVEPTTSDAELRHLADSLNDMLARLEHAFQTQEQVVSAQRRFILDASHELRSPLSNLRGTIEVALRRPRSPDEYHEVLGVCLPEVDRLGRLVDALLILSRMDSGFDVIRPGPCDLGGIARQAVAACGARAEEKHVEVALHLPESLTITGDGDRLRQVLDNLLDNALRHAPEGSRVAIRGEARNGEVDLTVRDSGPGLTAEERRHVFERFYRANAARDRDSGGLGVGLALVKAIVEAHGGRVSVDVPTGGGAAFKITLPRA